MWLHWQNAGKKATVTSRFGGKRVIAGRLLAPGGAPIAGAAIDLRVDAVLCRRARGTRRVTR